MNEAAIVQLSTDLRGKISVVTGASKGIGRAIAWVLAAAGADVVVSSRKQHDLDVLVMKAKDAGLTGRMLAFAANAGEPDQAAACIDAAIDFFGSVDILVNNAATNPYMGELVGLDLARAEKTFRVNQYGIVSWSGLVWRASMAEHGGTIINIASAGAMSVDRGIGFYNATKAAAVHLTRQLAVEMGPHVRVNCIAPGIVKTDMARALWESREQELADRLPLKRCGTPEDIAGAALFLASDNASWITGQTIVVDGGALVAPIMAD